MEAAQVKVMFVCLGNICRSPMAEALFRHKLQERGLNTQVAVVSSGTGAYHVGENADRRTISTLREHGIDYTHSAQQFKEHHLVECDYILAMDRSNREDILHLALSEQKSKISLMLSHGTNTSLRDVPDPYYGGADGFEKVYNLLDDALEGFLVKLVKEHQL